MLIYCQHSSEEVPHSKIICMVEPSPMLPPSTNKDKRGSIPQQIGLYHQSRLTVYRFTPHALAPVRWWRTSCQLRRSQV